MLTCVIVLFGVEEVQIAQVDELHQVGQCLMGLFPRQSHPPLALVERLEVDYMLRSRNRLHDGWLERFPRSTPIGAAQQRYRRLVPRPHKLKP